MDSTMPFLIGINGWCIDTAYSGLVDLQEAENATGENRPADGSLN